MRLRQKVIILALAGFFAMAGTGCGQKARQEKEATKKPSYKMVITNEVAVDHWKSKYMQEYAKLVEERTGGQIKAEFYPAGQLFSDKQAVESLGTGAVHSAWPVSVNVETISQPYGIISLPFALDEEMMTNNQQFYRAVVDYLSTLVDPQKYKVLGLMRTCQGVFITSKKQIKAPQDMAGLKFRTIGGQVSLDLINALGGSPVSMPATEMTQALAQGVIDGINSSPDGWATMIGATGKYGITIPNSQFLTYTCLFDAKWYDGLPADLQKVVRDTLDEVLQRQWKESKKLDEESFRKIKGFGGNFYLAPESEVGLWKEKTKSVIDKYKAKFPNEYGKFVELNHKFGRQWP